MSYLDQMRSGRPWERKKEPPLKYLSKLQMPELGTIRRGASQMYEGLQGRGRDYMGGAPAEPEPSNFPIFQDQASFLNAIPNETKARTRRAMGMGKFEREAQAHPFDTASTQVAELDRLDFEAQKRMVEDNARERRAELVPQGFTEFAGENSDPGALFYKEHGPKTNSAFGQAINRPSEGGTFSMTPMGGRALQEQEDQVATEDAGRTYARRLMEAKAGDPLGIGLMKAKRDIEQGPMLQADSEYQRAKAQLYSMEKDYSPERFQQALADLERQHAFNMEMHNPKGGFERFGQQY